MDENVKAARDAILEQIATQAPSCGAPLVRDLAEAYALVMGAEPEKPEKAEEMTGTRPKRIL